MRGSKPGERRGGRRPGAKNKRTLAREQAQAEIAVKIAAALGADAFDGDAHALLVAVYKDPAQPTELRMEAAKAAIGFEKPRLASVDGKFDANLSWAKIVEEVEEKRLRSEQQCA